jgi:glycosyltransferase involved in cell wall biosynthesis
MKISLCLIVWNELHGCQIDVPKIPRDAFGEIFAVDGGSSDGTVEYLESQGIKVFKQPKKGLNAAYVHANNIATGDAIVVFFPKGTMPTLDLLKFIPLLESGNDLVISSRQIAGSKNEEDIKKFRPRKWAVWMLAAIAALVWKKKGYWVRDVLHGVKGWKKTSFNKMKILDYGLSIDIEMVIRAYKFNMLVCEFPTTEIPRPHGESNFKIWPTGKKLLAYLVFESFRND